MPEKRAPRRSPLVVLTFAMLVLAFTPSPEPVAPREVIDLARYVPADTLLLLSVPSVPRAVEALKSHPFARAFGDAEFQELSKPLLAAIGELDAQSRRESGASLAEHLAMITGRAEVALISVSGTGDETAVTVAVVVELSDTAGVRASCEARLQTADPDGGLEKTQFGDVDGYRVLDETAFICPHEGKLLITTDRSLMGRLIERDPESEGRLADSDAYTEALDRVDASRSHAFLSANIPPLLRLGLASEEEEEREELTTTFRFLGWNGIGLLGMSLACGPRGVTETMYLHTGANRKGLMALLDCCERGLDPPARLPEGAVFYACGKLDFEQAFNTTIELAQKIMEREDPDRARQFRKALARMDDPPFGDRDEVFGALGSDYWMRVNLPRFGFVPEALMGVTLKDPGKIEALFAALFELEGEDGPLTRTEVGATTVYGIRSGEAPVVPGFAVVEDTLVFGVQKRSIVNHIRRATKAEGEGIAIERALEAAGLQGTDDLATLAVLDAKRVFCWIYSNLSPLMASLDPDTLPDDFDAAMLPDVETITDYLTPCRAGLWALRVHDDGLTSVCHGPVAPLSTLFFAGFIAGMLEDS